MVLQKYNKTEAKPNLPDWMVGLRIGGDLNIIASHLP